MSRIKKRQSTSLEQNVPGLGLFFGVWAFLFCLLPVWWCLDGRKVSGRLELVLFVVFGHRFERYFEWSKTKQDTFAVLNKHAPCRGKPTSQIQTKPHSLAELRKKYMQVTLKILYSYTLQVAEIGCKKSSFTWVIDPRGLTDSQTIRGSAGSACIACRMQPPSGADGLWRIPRFWWVKGCQRSYGSQVLRSFVFSKTEGIRSEFLGWKLLRWASSCCRGEGVLGLRGLHQGRLLEQPDIARFDMVFI